jgi:hypothetical protein
LEFTPTTELEAVNDMLQMIGEQPVNSLDNPGFLAASLARVRLQAVSRAIQAKGLNCNSEDSYTLARAADGTIQIPSNVLELDPVDTSIDGVMRGSRLYDRANHTYSFAGDVQVNVIFFLEFEELPQTVRNYITIKAARENLVKTIGAVDIYKMTDQEERDALVAFSRTELRSQDLNLGTSSSVSNILKR